MSQKKSKKKSVEDLDDVFLDALQVEIPEDLSAEEALSEEQLETLEFFIEEGEPEIERFSEESAFEEEESVNEESGLQVVVAEDGMSASLLANNCPPLELETIKEALRAKGVTYGIKEKALANVVTSIKTGGGWKGELIVARGIKPVLEDLMSFDFLTREKDPAGKKLIWMAGDVPVFFDEIKEILSAKSLQDINKSDARVKAVNPYEVIATLKGETTSLQGYNVFGESIGNLVSVPQAGDNVDFDEDDGTFTAEIFGYLLIDDKYISVLPPIWVTQDQMSMYFINLKQAGEFCFPYPENVQKMLIDEEVESEAFMIESIEKMSACFAAGKEMPRALKIARGVQPIPGTDAQFEFFHDTEIRAGTINEKDDSMDMRERNLVTSVEKETLLGEKVKAKKGVSGRSIFGNEIKAPDGNDRTIYYNEGVEERKKDGDIIEYYSKVDGNVSYNRDSVTVSDVFGVEGDVDYSTGNIEVKTGLTIGGSVCPGFSVKAGSNTIINGSVELGASVFVQGDLCIQKGIIGEETKVVVIGNLQVEFIQDANVIVKGDLFVKSYIFNANVRSGGEIKVHKEIGSKGGRIVGGVSCATNGIELSSVGSPSNRSTLVSIQPDPLIQGKKNKLADDVKYCDENIAKMIRTLQIKTFDPETIKAMLAQAPPDKKDMIIKLFTALNKFIKHREEAVEKRKQLLLYIDQCLKRAKIRVSAEFFEGNTVEIGEKRFVAIDDMGPSIFQLREGRIIH